MVYLEKSMAGWDVFLTLPLFQCIQCHKNEKRFTLACSIQRESQQRCSLGAVKSKQLLPRGLVSVQRR